MSSFLRDVLVKDAEDKHDLTEKIGIIKKETTKLKSVINEFMKDKYDELESHLKPDETLIDNSEKLISDIKNLQNRIEKEVKEELTSSSKELQNLSREIREYNYSLSLSTHLLEIHKCFESIEKYRNSDDKQCANAAISLMQLNSLVIGRNSDIQQLNIYNSIREEYNRIYDEFIEEIVSLWQESIIWYEKKESFDKKFTSLCVQCDSGKLTDIVQALHHTYKLKKCIESLSTKILHSFINVIINSECKVESTDRMFYVQVLDKKKTPSYSSVSDNLKLLFQFLHEHFNIYIENDDYFIPKLSSFIFKDFSQVLTANCISKIIPTSESELDTFQAIVSQIEDFQNYLVEIKFIDEEQKFLSKYTSNIDKLYIDKKCEKLLEAARKIMKKDLHDSLLYRSEKIEESIDLESDIKDQEDIIKSKLREYTFHFPECQISKSAQEILSLVEAILDEACNSNDNYALRLFYTSRNIFEMYASLIPEIHRSFLETIPQQVALFHNNCMYLAHNLLTLAYRYKSRMPGSETDYSMIYADQALLLRQVGYEYFLNHMKYQRDIIFEILRDSGLSSIGHMPQLPPTTERALRQCIRQLELLKTVWMEILPIKVYCRSVGCIVNDMIGDICSKVINVEDIPADIASELVTLFDMVIKRIPQIFPDPAFIEYHVKKWRQLKELIIILGASLREIEERWADGKGPLAIEFSPQHVKQLIRALFQNTERRSTLLSKIREK